MMFTSITDTERDLWLFVLIFGVFLLPIIAHILLDFYLRNQTKPVHINAYEMNLVSRNEFDTPNGKGIVEVYEDGKWTLTVTATPPERVDA